MGTERSISDIEDGHVYLEVPSSIDSLVSSAKQMRQLTHKIVNNISKQLICYGLYTDQVRSSERNQSRSDDITKINLIQSSRDDQQVVSFSSANGLFKNSPKRPGSSKEDLRSIDQKEVVKLLKDESALRLLDDIQKILPLFEEVSSTIELCVATLECTFKRAAYHLNKLKLDSTRATNENVDKSTGEESFKPTCGHLKLDLIMFALMDLIYSVVLLERVLKNHTTLKSDLAIFVETCRLVAESLKSIPSDENLRDEHQRKLADEFEHIALDKVYALIEQVGSIRTALVLDSQQECMTGTILLNMLDQLRHLDLILSKDKTVLGFAELQSLFMEFIQFYCEQILFTTTTTTTSSEPEAEIKKGGKNWRKLLAIKLIGHAPFVDSIGKRFIGILGLFGVFGIVFKRSMQANRRQMNKLLSQIMRKLRPEDNLVALEWSPYVTTVSSFVRHALAKVDGLQLDVKCLDQLEQHKFDCLNQKNLAIKSDSLELRANLLLNELSHQSQSCALASESHEGLEPIRFVHLHEQAISLAQQIRATVSLTLAWHQQHQPGRPINRANLVAIFRLVAKLKAISSQITPQQPGTTYSPSNMARLEHQARFSWRKCISSFMRRQLLLKYSDRRLHTGTLLTLTSACLKPELFSSSQGRLLASIYLLILADCLSSDECARLAGLLSLIAGCQLMLERLEAASECSFLYWSQPTFSVYYTWAFEEFVGAFEELQHFLLAVNDTPKLLQIISNHNNGGHGRPAKVSASACFAWLEAKRSRMSEQLELELCSQFRSLYLERVCQELEVELRLQTHRDLCADEHSSPFKRLPYNFKQILSPTCRTDCQFRLCGRLIDLRHYVEQYLNRVCYNLASLSPQDWCTYDLMLNVAERKFDLRFVPNQLPAQSLDSGLDLFELTRNLSLFAARYSYDLASELFIEKCIPATSSRCVTSGSQLTGASQAPLSTWLNVIQLEHISNWVYTHGFGILDSTVNCTYNALKRLVNVFSRQLADEHLCAALQKLQAELANSSKTSGLLHASQQQQHETEKSLSYERINRMAKRFKPKGSTGANETRAQTVDLDTIRQTITQIGNLLAFVRLIKSGALDCASKAVDFLPDLTTDVNDGSSFVSLIREELQHQENGDTLEPPLADCLVKAGQNFDRCLDDLKANFLPKSNYLDIIVKLFTEILAPGDNQSEASKASIGPRDEAPLNGAREQHDPPACSGAKVRRDNRAHLELFYLIVPLLTLDYIEQLISCKDRLTARSSAARLGALISDDGFAFGLAFLLTALKQTRRFHGLRWFDTVNSKLSNDIDEVNQRLSNTSLEEALRQTSNMTLRRVHRLHEEHQAFEHTFNCALLLLRAW